MIVNRSRLILYFNECNQFFKFIKTLTEAMNVFARYLILVKFVFP